MAIKLETYHENNSPYLREYTEEKNNRVNQRIKLQ